MIYTEGCVTHSSPCISIQEGDVVQFQLPLHATAYTRRSGEGRRSEEGGVSSATLHRGEHWFSRRWEVDKRGVSSASEPTATTTTNVATTAAPVSTTTTATADQLR